MKKRQTTLEQNTLETKIKIDLDLDGQGDAVIDTGLGFLDHLLTSICRHAGWDLKLTCQGDLQVDDHHTAEDCAIVLGQAFDQALNSRSNIARFGYAYAPLDEALARAVIDISSRPFAEINLGLRKESIGNLACENIEHFFQSLSISARICSHIDVIKGNNDHHRAEASAKAWALAVKQATVYRESDRPVPSTKGVLA